MTALATVCSYFNPCGYESRRRNYNAFRKNMEDTGVTLLSVELIFDPNGLSELGSCGDVLCVRGGDVMWQKERLLQIGIEHLLADGYSAVAWMDADITFTEKNWHENVLRALDDFDCVQSFDQLVSHYSEGRLVRPAAARDTRSWAHGGSWAATCEFWASVKLYQHCILGGADTIIANVFLQFSNPCFPAFRWPEDNVVLRQLNQPTREHVTDWARQSWAKYRIGYVADQTAHLLAHGARRYRYYLERWQLLKDYNPRTDVAISESGAFRWNCNKLDLKRNARRYFVERREDG